jgi:uncharacterized protein (DUF4213/DUF364 family)
MASTPHDSGSHHDRTPIREAGLLLEMDAKDLAYLANLPNQMEAAIGMATINSLIEVDEECCEELNARELLVKEGEAKKVAIIGHFPFIPQLRKIAKELWVIEKAPREGDLPETEADNIIPQAEVVGITGTTFTNSTIENLLKLCDQKAYVVILGGTAPLSPVLFDYGVDAVSGTKVIDSELVLNYVSQGATFRQIKGIRMLTMKKAW